MSVVLFDMLAARRKRNPTELTPAEHAQLHVRKEGVRIAAPSDLVQKACEKVADELACVQMQIAINRANAWLRNAVRQRQHYTGGDLPPAA